MSYPHAIRLRGPWQCEPLARYVRRTTGEIAESREGLPAVCRGTLPSDWGALLGDDFRGRVAYRRSFHPPASLDVHERAWLIVDGVDARGTVSLNGVRLGEIRGYALSGEFEVTPFLKEQNSVEIEVQVPLDEDDHNAAPRPGRENLPGGPIGEVRLEIRSAWFIDRLALWSLPGHPRQFAVSGQVSGETSHDRLAVVVSGCQRELAYFEASVGQRFDTTFAADDFPSWTSEAPAMSPVEAKLIAGGSAVWRKEIETGFRISTAEAASRTLDQILPERDYLLLDRAGTSVVQRVPLAWSGEVCPRLAHHPSIVAWSAVEGPAPATHTCGRLWI